MRLSTSLLLLLSTAAIASPILEPPQSSAEEAPPDSISQELFDELEELSRIVDIAYCVGTLNTGIEPPFQCLSYCRDFPTFELVKVPLPVSSFPILLTLPTRPGTPGSP